MRHPWLLAGLVLVALLVAAPALGSALSDDPGPAGPGSNHPRLTHQQAEPSAGCATPAAPRWVPVGKHPVLTSLSD